MEGLSESHNWTHIGKSLRYVWKQFEKQKLIEFFINFRQNSTVSTVPEPKKRRENSISWKQFNSLENITICTKGVEYRMRLESMSSPIGSVFHNKIQNKITVKPLQTKPESRGTTVNPNDNPSAIRHIRGLNSLDQGIRPVGQGATAQHFWLEAEKQSYPC